MPVEKPIFYLRNHSADIEQSFPYSFQEARKKLQEVEIKNQVILTRFFSLAPGFPESTFPKSEIAGFTSEHLRRFFHLRGPEGGAIPEHVTVLYGLYQEVRNAAAVYISSLDYIFLLFPNRLDEFAEKGTQALSRLHQNLRPLISAVTVFREAEQEFSLLVEASNRVAQKEESQRAHDLENVDDDYLPSQTLKMSVNQKFHVNAFMLLGDLERLEELNNLVRDFLKILPEYKKKGELAPEQIQKVGNFQERLLLFKDKLEDRN